MLNFNTKESRWKIYLSAAGALVMILSMFYVNYLANKLKDIERTSVELFVKAQVAVAKAGNDFNKDVNFELQAIEANQTPIIATDENDNVALGRNYGSIKDTDKVFLNKRLIKLKNQGIQPIKSELNNVYFENSRVLRWLKFFPLIQLMLLLGFLTLGAIGFGASQREQQNRVWVGMAKETAHQLGTPIGAIVAWVENLKLLSYDDPEKMELLDELRSDVTRLELIAERFSKIGSKPNLEKTNLNQQLDQCRSYMEKRASKKVRFDFPDPNENVVFANINAPLFDWVMENLMRNSLDAMDGTGTIKAEIYRDEEYISIDLSDTGKGMSTSQFKQVFEPGYTTKKRGWGLGLSLAKRIIENYHKGKIYVKKSVIGTGTTFSVKLPV
ncbi:MAG: HAMP domain-containing histidine kinase [Saprospiraceae bacterium]|jgi:signal transduction histidine kinase|nr:HAMP domain-containing histidine kinase [Saprospiraceae bacterium]MBK6479947.1 HAMP domain-containing histidine kinase [Saprospiraceae bacterium]MBK6815194.1 HAMP domain-containing histidine kinase [Saprospiraceae bacterium]MBK7372232.1 HAMP domain-containing histidine kinase [Saprospiraceae bacterium]MBK7435304.1 HAMP domain-containing histidine kinase [Saprospiraceae bacterium]